MIEVLKRNDNNERREPGRFVCLRGIFLPKFLSGYGFMIGDRVKNPGRCVEVFQRIDRGSE